MCKLLLLALVTAWSVTAPAGEPDQDEALSLRLAGKVKPLEELIDSVQERHPGARILEVELERENDVTVYEIELLTTRGEVRELEIDATTGRFLADEIED